MGQDRSKALAIDIQCIIQRVIDRQGSPIKLKMHDQELEVDSVDSAALSKLLISLTSVLVGLYKTIALLHLNSAKQGDRADQLSALLAMVVRSMADAGDKALVAVERISTEGEQHDG